jgi:glycyl-tRNA synthetase beta chain
VVRPRLADAEFFFNTDRKKRLEDNLPRLQTVLFQQQLGTLRDKTDRIQALAGWIARKLAPTSTTRPARACSPSAT